MVGYPRALRRAYQVVCFHPNDARAFVAGKIAHAVRTGHEAQAAEWHKILHFVERLLDDAPGPSRPPHARHRRPPRYRRVRTSEMR